MIKGTVVGLRLNGVETNDDLLRYMADYLIDRGTVKSTFKKAIIDREKIFSTGLNIGNYGIAIPHTDVEHVNESTIAIVTLENPIVFKQMGDNIDTPVSIVCMLALKESHAHLEMLQKLMELFQDEHIIETIINLDDTEENKEDVLTILREKEII
ncbi:PTS sugar transporter subunit IIA [Aerococcaceae bacterium zg-ZUI334]|uniref:PTS sugar transporter subunit IIA n=1 Tax=Aerococcaceae bacterium zg-252 TaxID=2796928 RepID=UPI001B917924|nr:PTS sugar transporter subunit IIA [Aerococcaceae bacterium zg-ZUI334]